MNFEEKLKKQQFDLLWQEYCGFLDLDLPSYMEIQKRLMLEQIQMWCNCELGRRILPGLPPHTIDEFRARVPLTDYADYADVLLQKRGDMLPDDPVIWIQTTWESGKHPVKLAPYTKSMLDVYKNNVISCLVLSTSNERGKFNVGHNDKMLYGLAPLPYATGILPLILGDEMSMEFLPPVKVAEKMSFSQRNKLGFKLGFQKGIDIFFGLSSVAYYISSSFGDMISSKGASGAAHDGGHSLRFSPKMIYRYLSARYHSKKNGTPIMPKDVFRLKGFVCAGTDSSHYKRALEEFWGVRPLEIMAGTEPTCIGCESWEKNGLYLFPDACFYEFIPENEMLRNFTDPSYKPKTYLMDELVPNQNYELVISVFKGGAFMRYRVGDVYRCLGMGSQSSGIRLPRFAYVDRVPTVIDTGGFTRITEASIEEVIRLSKLGIAEWFALKEYNEEGRPYLHMYVEMSQEAVESSALSRQVLEEHLSVYFTYFDSDYHDLKRLLGIDPLKITFLKSGTVAAYRKATGHTIRRINPSSYDMLELLRFQERDLSLEGGCVYL